MPSSSLPVTFDIPHSVYGPRLDECKTLLALVTDSSVKARLARNFEVLDSSTKMKPFVVQSNWKGM
jgi:hypothetical protein